MKVEVDRDLLETLVCAASDWVAENSHLRDWTALVIGKNWVEADRAVEAAGAILDEHEDGTK